MLVSVPVRPNHDHAGGGREEEGAGEDGAGSWYDVVVVVDGVAVVDIDVLVDVGCWGLVGWCRCIFYWLTQPRLKYILGVHSRQILVFQAV